MNKSRVLEGCVAALVLTVLYGCGGEVSAVSGSVDPLVVKPIAVYQQDFSSLSSTSLPPVDLRYTLKSKFVSVDLTQRRAYLSSLSEEKKKALCDVRESAIFAGYSKIDGTQGWLPRGDVASVFYPDPLDYIDWTNSTTKDATGYQAFYQETAQQRDAQLWFAFNDRVAGQRAIDAILLWAKSNAMKGCLGQTATTCYWGYRFVTSTLHSLDLLRSHPSYNKEFTDIVMPWIERVMTSIYILPSPLSVTFLPNPQDETFFSIPPPETTPVDCLTGPCGFSNHYAVRGQAAAQWAALVGDHQLFDFVINQVFRRSLSNIRKDGSHVAEIQREDYGLWYSSYHIGNMVITAEIAAQHGYDLYSMKNAAGSSLHTAVDFLTRAVLDPSLVAQYTGKNCTNQYGLTGVGCLPSTALGQNMEWLTKEFVGNRPFAWIDAYIRRFPNSPTTGKLREWKRGIAPLMDDMNGFASCLYSVD